MTDPTIPEAAPAAALVPDPFPVARYRLECEVIRPLELPEYAGSAFRGVFGHALKQLACVTSAPDCRTCPLYRSCAYPSVFETPPPVTARRAYSDIPNPFVVEPPKCGTRYLATGEVLELGLVLIGPALSRLPLLLLAWEQALMRGLGTVGGTARLKRVWAEEGRHTCGSLVLEVAPGARLREHAAVVPLPPAHAAPSSVAIELLTPLRLKREGRPVPPERFEPRDLLMGLVRRTADLCELQLGKATGWDFPALAGKAASISGRTQLQWREATRWSNRQQQHTPLGGIIGTVELEGDLKPFWQLLHLGQWLHVGGKATFGLGRYELAEYGAGGVCQ